MECVLQDMARGQFPFVFLMPADPAYYTGQGFVFFPCFQSQAQEEKEGLQAAEWKGRLQAAEWNGEQPADWNWQKAAEEDIPELAAFSNEILKGRCQIFINRSTHYYRRLMAETAAEHGGVLLGRNREKLSGILVYGLEELEESAAYRAEIRDLFLKEPVSEEEAKYICRNVLEQKLGGKKVISKLAFTPAEMMIRVTSLSEFVPLLKSREPLCLYVQVTDSVIRSNNGCFRIIVDREGGTVDPILERFVQRKLDISELTLELLADTAVYLNEWV